MNRQLTFLYFFFLNFYNTVFFFSSTFSEGAVALETEEDQSLPKINNKLEGNFYLYVTIGGALEMYELLAKVIRNQNVVLNS